MPAPPIARKALPGKLAPGWWSARGLILVSSEIFLCCKRVKHGCSCSTPMRPLLRRWNPGFAIFLRAKNKMKSPMAIKSNVLNIFWGDAFGEPVGIQASKIDFFAKIKRIMWVKFTNIRWWTGDWNMPPLKPLSSIIQM